MKRALVVGLVCSMILVGCKSREQPKSAGGEPTAVEAPDDFPMTAPPDDSPPVPRNGHASRPPASANGHGTRVPPYVVVPVFYATDRKPVTTPAKWREERERSGSATEYYGKEWSEILELGWCNVSIPTQVHETGAVERPRFWQSKSVEKHFVILTLEPSAPTNYFARSFTTGRAAAK